MRLIDLLLFTLHSLKSYRFRSAMVLLSIVMGVSSVVILTAIGEGARYFVVGEFSFLGKDSLVLFPGKTETTGGLPPVTGSSVKPITLEDVEVLQARVANIDAMAPMVIGSVPASYNTLSRNSLVVGTNQAFFKIRQLELLQGSPLPDIENHVVTNVCVIGPKLKRELFKEKRALGEWLRIADRRCRIIGVLGKKGDSFGMDLSAAVFIPVAYAQSIFNSEGLFRVVIKTNSETTLKALAEKVRDVMTEVHGKEDVTIVNPDVILGTFDRVLKTLTIAVSAISSISLIVAGVLIMNMTLIAINQRINEIGLLKALGAPSQQIRTIFLSESIVLTILGALLGLLVGEAVIKAAQVFYPTVPFEIPIWAKLGSVLLAVGTGLLFSYLPAQKAGKMDPVESLTKL